MSSVLIVGGATGIGLAAMRGFRSRGDSVFLVDVNLPAAQAAADEALPGPAIAFEADAAQIAAAAASADACAAAFGGIDTLFFNAGSLKSMPIEAWTADAWDASFAVNLRAPFLFAQSAMPYLKRSSNASVLFTSSTGALRGHAGMPAYHAAKAGLIGLVRSLADELSPQGIRVNCICPGWIDTPFNRPFWSFQADAAKTLRGLTENIPARRQGTPDDTTGLILFLSSPGARYITGTSMVVDGGYTAV